MQEISRLEIVVIHHFCSVSMMLCNFNRYPTLWLGVFSLYTEKNLIDMSNSEFARGVAGLQMKLEQWYRISVVFIAVTMAGDFLYKRKVCMHRLYEKKLLPSYCLEVTF